MTLAVTADAIATVVEAIAGLLWPVLILLALILLRKPLSSMIGNIRKGKMSAGSIAFEFGEEVQQAASSVGRSLGDPPRLNDTAAQLVGGSPPNTYLNRVALTDPAGAVEQAWKQVQESVIALTKAQGLDADSLPGTLERANALVEQDRIDPALVSSINQLRRLYYQVKQNRSLAVTPADASAYVSTAQALCDALERIPG